MEDHHVMCYLYSLSFRIFIHSDKKILIQNVKTFSSGTNAQNSLTCGV